MEKCNTTAVTINTGFIGELPTTEVAPLAKKGLVLYSPNKSMTFYPLVLKSHAGRILVTPQDHIPENELIDLFSGEDFSPTTSCTFDEDALTSLLKDEPEYLPDIVILLEKNDSIKPDKMIGLISHLVEEKLSLCNIVQVLDTLSREQVSNLVVIYDDFPSLLLKHFTKLVSASIGVDEEDEEY